MRAPENQSKLDEIEQMWSLADYGPTGVRLAPVANQVAAYVAGLATAGANVVDVGAGHGQLSAELAARGFSVVAVEPSATLAAVGAAATAAAAAAAAAGGHDRKDGWGTVTWHRGRGEDLGLPDDCADVVVSDFALFFADHTVALPEVARVLRPGGRLVFTAWSERGFLHDMTTRMIHFLPWLADAPHLQWASAGVAQQRLAPWFRDVSVTHHDLPWRFDDVAEGMRLYTEGSPAHSASFAAAGDQSDELLAALEAHLRQVADPSTGRIETSTGWVLIEGRVADPT